MEEFVVFQDRKEKFGRFGYFDVYFPKSYLFSKFKSSMTSLKRHNKCILEIPCNFAIFKGRRQKFCKLRYFDVFS